MEVELFKEAYRYQEDLEVPDAPLVHHGSCHHTTMRFLLAFNHCIPGMAVSDDPKATSTCCGTDSLSKRSAGANGQLKCE